MAMEGKKKKAPPITPSMFDAIKILLQGGAMFKEIAKYTGVSETTIGRVKAAESFEEYQNMLAAMRASFHTKYSSKKKSEAEDTNDEKQEVKEIHQNVTVQTTHYVSQKMDQIIELLKGLSAKLAFIVDELTSTPNKEGK